MLFLTLTLVVGTFASFPTSIPLFTTRVIGSGVGVYGLLSTMLAVGMLIGATLATLYADKVGNRQRLLLLSSSALGALEVVLGLMPSVWLFGLMLVGAGIATTVFVTTAHSTIQLSAEPEVRGRVMGLYMLVLLGGTPIGSPLTGWLADTFGGRAPFAVGGVVTLLTALVCGVLLSFGPRGPQVKTPAPGTTRV